MYQKALIITGPTTSGKTEVALEVARRNPDSVLVNMDLTFTLRGFPLSTGYADVANKCQRSVLYPYLDITSEPPTREEYVQLAGRVTRDLLSEGRLPIFEGGTMDYLLGLMEGPDAQLYGPVVSLKLPTSINWKGKMERRLDIALQMGLLDEIKDGISSGLEQSHIMTQTIVIPPIVCYLKGDFSLEEAKTKIINSALTLASNRLADLEKLAFITWVNHNPEKANETVEKIIAMVQ